MMASAAMVVINTIPSSAKKLLRDGHMGRRAHSSRIMKTGPAMITPRASAKNHVKRISSATLAGIAYIQTSKLAVVKDDKSATETAAAEIAKPSRKTPSHGHELQIRL